MFERYSEKARRVIFFARYEASNWGDHFIQAEHLFLGLLREDRGLFGRLLHSPNAFPNAAEEMGLKVVGQKASTSVDLPLSQESKQVLVYAAEEAEHLGHDVIGTSHLLLGLLRQPGAACNLLVSRGMTLETARAVLKETPGPEKAPDQSHLVNAGLPELRSAFSKVFAQKGPGNERIVSALRLEFEALNSRLRPELEPAVVYSPRVK